MGKGNKDRIVAITHFNTEELFFLGVKQKKEKQKLKKRKSEDDDNNLTPSEIIHQIEMKSNPTGTNN
ncbi:hypothetical protein CYV15_08720 [Riemerella anatipestifer]|nr:hypothetical protein CYV15_08720 [Riemerella anatipestifer]